jgi:hypothetical protein
LEVRKMGFDVGEVLTPGVEYENPGGGGVIIRPPLPSNTIAFPSPPMTPLPSYTPSTPTWRYYVAQPPKSGDSGTEIWAYAMIAVMVLIMVIVLAVVL